MNLYLRSNPFTAPACLPSEQKHPAHGTRCWAAGWGHHWGLNDPSIVVSTILQEVDLEIINDDTCLKTPSNIILYFDRNNLVADRMFCTGYLKSKKDACKVI